MKSIEAELTVKPIDCLNYIDGKYVPLENDEKFENINLATEEK